MHFAQSSLSTSNNDLKPVLSCSLVAGSGPVFKQLMPVLTIVIIIIIIIVIIIVIIIIIIMHNKSKSGQCINLWSV